MTKKKELGAIAGRLTEIEGQGSKENGRYCRRTAGPGGIRKNAIVVNDVPEEYELVMEMFGNEASVMQQELFVLEGRRYDRLKVRLDDERWTYVWFDITEYWKRFEKALAERRRNRAK